MMSGVAALRQSAIFSSLSQEELEELSSLATKRDFRPDEFIFWEGDAPDYFYIVTAGRVKAVKYTTSGKEFIITFFGPGEMLGEVAVFENKPYPASAQSVVATSVLAIRKDDFLKFLSKHPAVALRIIHVLGGRLRDAANRLKDLAGERVEQRLARILVMLSAKLGKTLPFTRQELADMAGTTTETAIRFTTQLKERGIIRTERGKIIIINETKLRLLAEGPPRV